MFAGFWLQFAILFGAALIGVACVMPYTLELTAQAFAQAVARLRQPRWVIILLQSAQSAVLIALATGFGLLIAHQIELGAPLLAGLLAGQDVTAQVEAMLAPAIILGVGSSALMMVLEITIFWPRLPKAMLDAPIPALWKRFLACFYGGIDEEILLRLFLLSLLAWLIGFIWHDANGLPTLGALWIANILAALIFGLGHLPATIAIVKKLTPLLVVRALLLNGIVGVAAGYLYWRYGIEAAMLAHFSADLVFHLIGDSVAIRVRAKWLSGVPRA
jgi:hypothetical protein